MAEEKMEVESKYIITKNDFTNIVSENKIKTSQSFLNIYYDFNQKLYSESITFRMRYFEENNFRFTLKVPKSTNSLYRNCSEIETDLEKKFTPKAPKKIDFDRNLPSKFQEMFEELNLDSIYRLGWLRVNRLVLDFADGFEIEMDRVKMPDDQYFFEIEYEDQNTEKQKQVLGILKETVSTLKRSKISKYERFYRNVTTS